MLKGWAPSEPVCNPLTYCIIKKYGTLIKSNFKKAFFYDFEMYACMWLSYAVGFRSVRADEDCRL